MEKDFYQTEKVGDISPEKIGQYDAYFGNEGGSDALLARGKLTVQDGLNKNDSLNPNHITQDSFNQLNDPQKNNFMRSQSQFQQQQAANGSTITADRKDT